MDSRHPVDKTVLTHALLQPPQLSLSIAFHLSRLYIILESLYSMKHHFISLSSSSVCLQSQSSLLFPLLASEPAHSLLTGSSFWIEVLPRFLSISIMEAILERIKYVDRSEQSENESPMRSKNRWSKTEQLHASKRTQAEQIPGCNEKDQPSTGSKWSRTDRIGCFQERPCCKGIDDEQWKIRTLAWPSITIEFDIVQACYLQDRRECPELKCFVSV